jgi:hypothetical protein
MTPLPAHFTEWLKACNERFARFSGSQFAAHELPGGPPHENKPAGWQATKLCREECCKREMKGRQRYCLDCARKEKRESNRRHISGEEWLARLYCEPKAFWHCTRQLDGSRYYIFAEINLPQNWLKAVASYTEQEPSAAARQLYRRVEAARAEFRARQEKIYGERTLYAISRNRKAIHAKEDAAWNTFNAQKQAYLRDYLKTIASGVVRRIRTGRKCKQCNTAKVTGRARYCDLCAKQRQRDSLRASRKRKHQKRLLGDISSPLETVQINPLTAGLIPKNSLLASDIPEGVF